MRLNENKINILKDTDFSDYKTTLDEVLMEVDRDSLDIEQHGAVLQSLLIEAGLKTFGRVAGTGRKKTKKKNNKKYEGVETPQKNARKAR